MHRGDRKGGLTWKCKGKRYKTNLSIRTTNSFFTQGIECQWVDAKTLMKRARSPGTLLKSHLDECARRKLRMDHTEVDFVTYFKDIARVCYTPANIPD